MAQTIKKLRIIFLVAFTALLIGVLIFQPSLKRIASFVSMRVETSQQNEAAISVPAQRPRAITEYSDTRNLYFGDTHVHTSLSFDSYLFGNRIDLREAYEFANGREITLLSGESIQLSQPLDFVVMSDHAEGFGLFVTCARDDLSDAEQDFCDSLDRPSRELFMTLRQEGEKRPPQRPQALYSDEAAGKLDRAQEDAMQTWQSIIATAEEYNQPGEFSAFVGYEYSPPLPQRGKVHRNVVFKNANVPAQAVSAFDAATVLDLWQRLENDCIGECEFLTIPHNLNKSWGVMYSGKTIDGDQYSDADWVSRARNEPLAEIFQVKGSSECGYGVGANDEECNFELNVPICDGEDKAGCSGRTSFAREGLKIGLQLNDEIGFNPIKTGFIGSSDGHNSNAGATEEYNYRGASGLQESPARKRLGIDKQGNRSERLASNLLRNPGGLAAVWAFENTRESIFEAMQRKETCATSGGRILLRFFAGWDYFDDVIASNNSLELAYQRGVPMGGELFANPETTDSPTFVVWARKDANGADLQKIQIVKAWLDKGKTKETVYDISCGNGALPNSITHKCPAMGAYVDLNTCQTIGEAGAVELATKWRDPEFSGDQAAFYYVRVLENPSCRWSTYDALRLNIEPIEGIPATIQERAWSSPIWYAPKPE